MQNLLQPKKLRRKRLQYTTFATVVMMIAILVALLILKRTEAASVHSTWQQLPPPPSVAAWRTEGSLNPLHAQNKILLTSIAVSGPITTSRSADETQQEIASYYATRLPGWKLKESGGNPILCQDQNFIHIQSEGNDWVTVELERHAWGFPNLLEEPFSQFRRRYRC